jgi:hypothetical protein
VNAPNTTVLAGPPGEGPDLLRAALRRNRDTLRPIGVEVRQNDEPALGAFTHRLLVLNAPAPPRLAALRDLLDGPFRTIVYVAPPQAALLARVERDLRSGRSLARQFRRPRSLGYRAMLERYEQAFGADAVTFRVAGPAHLPGEALFEDFWRFADLPGGHACLGLGDLRTESRLSLEGALILDRMITKHAKYLDPKRNRHVAASAQRSAGRIDGRPFALSADHAAAVMEASREDIDWLATRVGAAALSEPRLRNLDPAWAMDEDALNSIAALIVRAARQTAELRARRANTGEQAAQGGIRE